MLDYSMDPAGFYRGLQRFSHRGVEELTISIGLGFRV